MSSFPFRLTRGDVVYIDGRRAEVHCELPDGRAQFLDAESFLAIVLSVDEVREKFRDRTLSFEKFRSIPVEFRNGAELTLEHFPVEERPAMRRRKEYLDAVDEAPGRGFGRPRIEPILKRVAARLHEAPPHYKTVACWAKTRGGRNRRLLNELRTKNDKKGGHSRLTPLQKRFISDAIKDVYEDKRQLPGDAVWATIVTNIDDFNKALPEQCRVKCPSKPTVHRYLRLQRDYRTTRLREGVDRANKIFRFVGESPEIEEINDLWVGDATRLDNLVVLDTKNMVLLGNPTLTQIMDGKSRQHAGRYLGFEPPSHLSMSLALRHAIAPKSLAETTRPDGSRRTFAEGVPFNLLLDNAKENKSPSMKDALASVGINPTYAPKHDPEYKGFGEHFFDILNNLLIRQLPGVTKIKGKRATDFGIDPQKDAVITLDFLNELITDAIDIYSTRFHTTIQAAPEDAWKRGLQKTKIELPASLESLNILLGRIEERTLNRKGIRFAGLRYGSNDVTFLLDQLIPLSEERSPDSVRVKIKYDPGDLGAIWVFSPLTEKYVELPCLQQKYARGLTLHHHKQILAHARIEHRKLHSEVDLCRAKVALRKKVEAAFGGQLLREKKRAARIVTVKNKRFVGDVLQTYDEAASSLSTLDQSLEETILFERDDFDPSIVDELEPDGAPEDVVDVAPAKKINRKNKPSSFEEEKFQPGAPPLDMPEPNEELEEGPVGTLEEAHASTSSTGARAIFESFSPLPRSSTGPRWSRRS